ncbi:hypothetical protein FOZ62_011348, partial [Perkinsus olseni]
RILDVDREGGINHPNGIRSRFATGGHYGPVQCIVVVVVGSCSARMDGCRMRGRWRQEEG